MHEIVINLHMHTRYSDGTGTHAEIAAAALKANVEVVIVTDHNVLVHGFEGYYRGKKRNVLLLIGEELHDQARAPQKNHLLVLGASRELAMLADDPQHLIDAVRDSGGLSFIAHPIDPAAPAFNETDISWEDWSVQRYTGIEIWNGLSELKTIIPSKMHGVFYAYFPALAAHRPISAALEKWDELLKNGNRVVAIGGSDAHALHMRMGFLHRVIYPYEFHFRAINTHAILSAPLSGELSADRKMVYEALARGNCFIGYDLPASTRGFRFTAQGRDRLATMGDEIPAKWGVTLQAKLPRHAEIHLLHNGEVIRTWKNQMICTHITTEPGSYRLEAYRRYLGKKRGWIFSNPIYVR
ncbi:MAG: PHP domain-containing protein [Chloroflexi bacterium]|nr:PHP domain-containing protein [Chloroflexota bacterium]